GRGFGGRRFRSGRLLFNEDDLWRRHRSAGAVVAGVRVVGVRRDQRDPVRHDLTRRTRIDGGRDPQGGRGPIGQVADRPLAGGRVISALAGLVGYVRQARRDQVAVDHVPGVVGTFVRHRGAEGDLLPFLGGRGVHDLRHDQVDGRGARSASGRRRGRGVVVVWI